jgi:cytochrome c oxidase assembly protein subunit 15
VLGGLVVRHHLAPGLVMSHFILSMILLDAAFALAWCARYEPGERPPSTDRLGVWAVRALVPIGQATIVLGTMVTAAGPHAGAHEGELVRRFTFKGSDTLSWMVQRHGTMAAIFAVAAIAVWFLLRRRGGDRRSLRPLTVLIAMLGFQGLLGITQYRLKLPAGMVWVHVASATITWMTVLWTVASAGRLEPRRADSLERQPVLSSTG